VTREQQNSLKNLLFIREKQEFNIEVLGRFIGWAALKN
jgi:hypothetical protein